MKGLFRLLLVKRDDHRGSTNKSLRFVTANGITAIADTTSWCNSVQELPVDRETSLLRRSSKVQFGVFPAADCVAAIADARFVARCFHDVLLRGEGQVTPDRRGLATTCNLRPRHCSNH